MGIHHRVTEGTEGDGDFMECGDDESPLSHLRSGQRAKMTKRRLVVAALQRLSVPLCVLCDSVVNPVWYPSGIGLTPWFLLLQIYLLRRPLRLPS